LFIDRDNYLRAVRFERPDYIPILAGFNAACWHHYPPEALQALREAHPRLFPFYKEGADFTVHEYGPNAKAGVAYTDDFGCVWTTTDDGITGTVTGHPLADWSALESYQPPDPAKSSGLGPTDWDALRRSFAELHDRGGLALGGLRHGHTFLALSDIRGYQNLVYDMVDEEPRLWRLIDMLERFNMGIITRMIAAGADVISYPEDLGMQRGPMLSPTHFKKYILPSYRRLMIPAHEAGCVVHMHSDGDIRTLVDDLAAGGVDIINLQDLVNGIDWIAERLAGRICIDLDVDRQQVTRYGTPAEIDALIRREVEMLGRKEGGLIMTFGLYPGTPLENVAALLDAFDRYSTYYA